MEELFSNNKLGELEEKVEALIQTYRGMREEKASLMERIESLEAENRDLKEQMSKARGDRDVVMQKVKGILEKIEQIEV